MDNRIYFDHVASTPISSEVYREMLNSYQHHFGNANSLHSFGEETSLALEDARKRVAESIGASTKEIYFTSGGTESNNWAIIGIARAYKDKGNHIIISEIEHHSVIESCKLLEQEGFVISYIPVDENGVVILKELIKLVTPQTILISVMTANNIVGSIQPIHAISEFAKSCSIIFHTDAIQAIGEVKLNVKDLKIDAMSISAHKINGPKGIGAIYVRNGVDIEKFFVGGKQEQNKRAGTLNVPIVVGFAKALEIAVNNRVENTKVRRSLRRYTLSKIRENITNTYLNGHPVQRISGLINLSFEGINGEALAILLNEAGIAVSATSACESTTNYPSHVLRSMKLDSRRMFSAIRISLSIYNSNEEIDKFVLELAKAVKKLRSLSPVRLLKEEK